MNNVNVAFSDQQIVALRPPKNHVDADRPYAFLVEPELTREGVIEHVATVFLTNRECPFRCLMCDLWKNTTDTTVPLGAIPMQIDHALQSLPKTRHIKLYNSGNFFDAKAIPPADHEEIAKRLRGFANVIVENHPNLCSESCSRFADMLSGDLEIAMGLETVHRGALAGLNKRMTVDDFKRATELLLSHGIHVRAFVLLKPPGFSDDEMAVEWSLRTLEFAFQIGVQCCAVIPTRIGNGVMDTLVGHGKFAMPRLSSLERVMSEAIVRGWPRTFVDLWDVERFAECDRCLDRRVQRLRHMNLAQSFVPPISCNCGTTESCN